MDAAPPPSYQQVTQPQQQGFPLSYVDFSPVMTEQGGVFSSPKYERFDTLINKANAWLQQNPGVRVLCCESVESKAKMNTLVADTTTSTFYEYGERSNWFHRTLRLFIRSSGPQDPPMPQQIGYLNVVPACTDPGGVFSMPKFADFGTTIGNLNAMFRQNPIQGRILNIETQDVKFKTWGSGVDPDSCFWREYGEQSTYFLNVIRIFFESGPPAYEEIGTADFVPDCLKPGGFLSVGCFQTIGETMQKANAWIAQQQGVRVTNVQTIDYKVSSSWGGDRIDTMRSLFREYGEHTTRYLRIVRVCWTRPFAQNNYPPPQPISCVTYRTFLPGQVTAGGVFSHPHFEPQPETMKRGLAWLQATGARVVSAETVPVRMYTGNQHGNTEQTYTYNRGERNEYWLIVIRIFLDGVYNDPPPEVLPPLPTIAPGGDECCTIL